MKTMSKSPTARYVDVTTHSDKVNSRLADSVARIRSRHNFVTGQIDNSFKRVEKLLNKLKQDILSEESRIFTERLLQQRRLTEKLQAATLDIDAGNLNSGGGDAPSARFDESIAIVLDICEKEVRPFVESHLSWQFVPGVLHAESDLARIVGYVSPLVVTADLVSLVAHNPSGNTLQFYIQVTKNDRIKESAIQQCAENMTVAISFGTSKKVIIADLEPIVSGENFGTTSFLAHFHGLTFSNTGHFTINARLNGHHIRNSPYHSCAASEALETMEEVETTDISLLESAVAATDLNSQSGCEVSENEFVVETNRRLALSLECGRGELSEGTPFSEAETAPAVSTTFETDAETEPEKYKSWASDSLTITEPGAEEDVESLEDDILSDDGIPHFDEFIDGSECASMSVEGSISNDEFLTGACAASSVCSSRLSFYAAEFVPAKKTELQTAADMLKNIEKIDGNLTKQEKVFLNLERLKPTPLQLSRNRPDFSQIIDCGRGKGVRANRVATFGRNRNANGEKMLHPIGCCRNEITDQVIVCDTNNHMVKLFESSGKFSRCLVRTDRVRFHRPSAVCAMRDGSFFVKDKYTIQHFDVNAQFLKCIRVLPSTHGGQLYGLTFSSEGHLVTIEAEISVTPRDSRSENYFLRTFDPVSGAGMSRIALALNSGYRSRIRFIDAFGDRLVLADYGKHLLYLVGNTGVLFGVIPAHSVHPQRSRHVSGEFYQPAGLCIDSGGNIFCADKHDRIQIFDMNGTYKGQVMFGDDEGVTRPSSLSMTYNGHLLVNVYDENYCAIFGLYPFFH